MLGNRNQGDEKNQDDYDKYLCLHSGCVPLAHGIEL